MIWLRNARKNTSPAEPTTCTRSFRRVVLMLAFTTVLWPKATFTFRRKLARFDADAYDAQAARPTPDREAVA